MADTNLTCIVEGCDPSNRPGPRPYCSMHYQRVKSGKGVGPAGRLIRKKAKIEYSDGVLRRTCPTCEEAKPVSEYLLRASGQYSHRCRPCEAAYRRQERAERSIEINLRRRELRRANPEKTREHAARWYEKNHLQARMIGWRAKGILVTEAEYLEMYETQRALCAICAKSEAENGKALALDHCHETNRVRGLLCDACNVGLGRFRDDTALMKRAIEYLTTTI